VFVSPILSCLLLFPTTPPIFLHGAKILESSIHFIHEKSLHHFFL
jgi:hypothetical protein